MARHIFVTREGEGVCDKILDNNLLFSLWMNSCTISWRRRRRPSPPPLFLLRSQLFFGLQLQEQRTVVGPRGSGRNDVDVGGLLAGPPATMIGRPLFDTRGSVISR